MKAIILASGEGKNLLPFTATRPKPMINICGRSIIENIIDMTKECGINSIYVTVGQQHKSMGHFFSRPERYEQINYLYQEKESGIGGAVRTIKNKISKGEYFLLVYGDIITSENIIHSTIQSFNTAKGPVASICLTQSTGLFGNVYFDDKMRITKILEKPKGENLGNYILSGVYILPSDFISILEDTELDMAKALSILVRDYTLTASIWENDWVDVGFPWEILEANRILMSRWNSANISATITLKGNVVITGPVQIEEGVEIRSGAVIEGPSFIGAGSFIGNNVLIRKNTSIGKGCVIGYGVELKNCILFGNSRVGRLSFIGDSVIGSNVEIGAGTMTINRNIDHTTVRSMVNGEEIDTRLEKLGAFIGDNAEIGSGHTLMAGVSIENDARIPHHYTYPIEK